MKSTLTDDIIAYCLKKPGAFLAYPFGPDATIIKVKSQNGPARIFAQLFSLNAQPMATFSCEAMTAEFFRSAYPDHVQRGYHCPPVQQPYFNTVRLGGGIPDDVLFTMADHAYRAVISKMPKKYRAELSEEHEGK